MYGTGSPTVPQFAGCPTKFVLPFITVTFELCVQPVMVASSIDVSPCQRMLSKVILLEPHISTPGGDGPPESLAAIHPPVKARWLELFMITSAMLEFR